MAFLVFLEVPPEGGRGAPSGGPIFIKLLICGNFVPRNNILKAQLNRIMGSALNPRLLSINYNDNNDNNDNDDDRRTQFFLG